MITRIKKAGGGNPPASTSRQPLSYRRPTLASRRNHLERAAEVLLVLQLPLPEIGRMGLSYIFERQLRQAYEVQP